MKQSPLKTAIRVASWEFNRFFKWKSVVSGLLTMLVMGALGFFGTYWLFKDNLKSSKILVIENKFDRKIELKEAGFEFTIDEHISLDSALVSMGTEQFDGVLSITSIDSAKLWLPGKRAWTSNLTNYLTQLRFDAKLSNYDIDKPVINDINSEIKIESIIVDEVKNSKINVIIAAIFISLVLIALFMGFSYQFTAITGEKQQRITEQVVSAIEPQSWIDGKILGITGIGLMYVLLFGGLSLLGTFIIATVMGYPMQPILNAIDPLMVGIFLLFALLGILMWNSFLAAVAATVDDPYTSDKTSLMLLPILPVLFSFFTLINADAPAVRFFALFPLTSYAVLPARLALTHVAWWEIVLALLLLSGTTVLFRYLAGKIFSTAMLMYGKEPSFKELYFWMKKN